MTADPAHVSMLTAVLAPPRHRGELLRVRRELARLIPILTEWSYDLSRQVDALRARERELAVEDSLPRLLYADWLDEHAESAECPVCSGLGIDAMSALPVPKTHECPRCRGAGRVCEGAERAAFIRTQCELARLPACGHEAGWQEQPAACPGCRAGTPALRRREQELLKASWRSWVCPALLEIWNDHLAARTLHGRRDLPEHAFHFTRGFVENLVCGAAAFLRHADALTAAAPLRAVRLTDRPRYQAAKSPDGSVTCWLVGRYRDRAVVLPHEVAAVARAGRGYADWLLSRYWPLIEFKLLAADAVQEAIDALAPDDDDRMPGPPDPVHRGPGPRPGRLGL